jgi:hypothetical protein
MKLKIITSTVLLCLFFSFNNCVKNKLKGKINQPSNLIKTLDKTEPYSTVVLHNKNNNLLSIQQPLDAFKPIPVHSQINDSVNSFQSTTKYDLQQQRQNGYYNLPANNGIYSIPSKYVKSYGNGQNIDLKGPLVEGNLAFCSTHNKTMIVPHNEIYAPKHVVGPIAEKIVEVKVRLNLRTFLENK